jgi:hypothetical protein
VAAPFTWLEPLKTVQKPRKKNNLFVLTKLIPYSISSISLYRTQSTRPACNESDIIIVEALRVLAMAYPKPIPPLDWCFLHEYFHRDLQMRKYCVVIAAKQIVCSGTAKRLIENYLIEFNAADSVVSDLCCLSLSLTLPKPSKLKRPKFVTQ